MFRSALLVLVAACSSAPRSTLSNANKAPARYTVQPFRLHGGMRLHSATQSWTTYAGKLELAVDTATLTLEMSTDTAYIHCPKEGREGRTYGRQECAPDDAKGGTSTSSLALSGFSRWENGKLLITVRKDDTAVTFTCDEKGKRLDCAYDDDYTLFGHVGARPQRVLFDRG